MRIRTSLRLLNCAIALSGEITHELAISILKSIRQRQESVSLQELSYTFRIIGDLLDSIAPFGEYLSILMQTWQTASVVHEQFHLVHLRFFASLPDDALPSFFGTGEESVITRSLRSDRPSQFVMGLRQFEKVVTLDSPRAIRLMRNLSQAAIERFERFTSIEGVVASLVRIFMALAVNPTYAVVHSTIHAALAGIARYPPSAAYFCDGLAWLPTVTRDGANVEPTLASLRLFMRIHSPQIFALAAGILTAQIRIATPDRKDAVAMEAYLTFLSEHTENQSYFTTLYLRGFAGIFQALDKHTLFHFCINSAKALRFLPVFFCIAEVMRDVADAEWVRMLADALLGIVEAPAHRQAIEKLVVSGINHEAFMLACAS
jgi:hypothetical protein